MTLAPDDPRHGTNHAYNKHACRCDPCHDAHLEALREYAARNAFLAVWRECDERARNGRIDAEYGVTLTFRNGEGETLTVHRRGVPREAVQSLCAEARLIDDGLRIVAYSTPATILGDLQGRPRSRPLGSALDNPPSVPEPLLLSRAGELRMMHPSLRGRSLDAERKYRAVDARAR